MSHDVLGRLGDSGQGELSEPLVLVDTRRSALNDLDGKLCTACGPAFSSRLSPF